MIGHLLGDFYFQTNTLAEKKKTSLKHTFLHSLIYSIIMFGFILLFAEMHKRYIFFTFIIGISHFIVDGIKSIICKKVNTEKYELLLFIVDQLIHMIILYIMNYWYVSNVGNLWNIGTINSQFNGHDILTVICAILICGKPSAIIVSLVFKKIPKTISDAEKTNKEDSKDTEDKTKEKTRIGSWIGMLEREIILVLGLLGEYGAIGFVVAAKSVARHSQLDNENFAEKYLIGTLLSTFIALLCIAICISI